MFKLILKVAVFLIAYADAQICAKAWDDVIDYVVDTDEDTKFIMKIMSGSIVGGIIGLLARAICKRIK